jgi:NADPH:quinone reductase
MLAMRIDRAGGPDVLTPVDTPVPELVNDEVLVRNAWIGVNYVDLQHRGGSPYKVRFPLVPGIEAAGVVQAVGPTGDPGLVGRPVVHFGHMKGVYADYTAAPAAHVVLLDPDTPLDMAAAVAMSGTTAHVLTRLAVAVAGRTVVVHAAAGSTGGAVVQLAAAGGATVIAITSTRTKARSARGLGAHHAIALDDEPDPVHAVRRATDGLGAHVVYDATGKDTIDASLRMLRTRGTLVVYGAASGEPEPLPLGRLSGLTGMQDEAGSLTVCWVSAGDYLVGHERRRAMRAVLADVCEGRLSARIAGRWPLREAAAAHTHLAGRSVPGKLLLMTTFGGEAYQSADRS